MIALAVGVGARRFGLAAPADLGARDWILGVAAIQAWADGGRVRARLRCHRTGAGAAEIVELAPGDTVALVLIDAAIDAEPLLAAARGVPAARPGLTLTRARARRRTGTRSRRASTSVCSRS